MDIKLPKAYSLGLESNPELPIAYLKKALGQLSFILFVSA